MRKTYIRDVAFFWHDCRQTSSLAKLPPLWQEHRYIDLLHLAECLQFAPGCKQLHWLDLYHINWKSMQQIGTERTSPMWYHVLHVDPNRACSTNSQCGHADGLGSKLGHGNDQQVAKGRIHD